MSRMEQTVQPVTRKTPILVISSIIILNEPGVIRLIVFYICALCLM